MTSQPHRVLRDHKWLEDDYPDQRNGNTIPAYAVSDLTASRPSSYAAFCNSQTEFANSQASFMLLGTCV